LLRSHSASNSSRIFLSKSLRHRTCTTQHRTLGLGERTAKGFQPHEVPVSIKYILYIHLWHNTLCFFFNIHIMCVYIYNHIYIYIIIYN
jgi:hypothetical protein